MAPLVNTSTEDLLPTPSTKSFWHSEAHPLAEHRSTEDLPTECDVAIIGSGYAGTATAYHLIKSGFEGSIVILEARQACSGATGRNGGHLRPDAYGQLPQFVRRYGVEAAREWIDFETSHVEAITNVIEEEGIDCDFRRTRSTACYIKDEVAKTFREKYDYLSSLDLPHMKDVQLRCDDEAVAFSGVKKTKTCLSITAGSLWPYKFVMTCMARALASGRVNLQTNTPVAAVHSAATGTSVIETSRGSIRASKVVFANNAYTSRLLPQYAKSIIPCKGRCTHIAVPDDKKAPKLTHTYVIRDDDNVMSYLVPRPDGGIIVGGSSKVYASYLDQWYNTIDDGTAILAGNDYYDGFMQRHFVGWEDSGAYVKTAWTGIMGYSFDSLPHLGQVPGQQGQYILAGFNGHGMPAIWLAAKGVADMVKNGKSYEDVGLPAIGKTTQERIDRAWNGPEGGDILAK